MTACARKKVLLMILDGWGIGRGDRADVIGSVRPQRLGEFAAKYPHAELRTDGENVGLPDGQMGNSEVGHLNIGAGRVLYQDLVKINRAVADGSIGDNPEVKALRTSAACSRSSPPQPESPGITPRTNLEPNGVPLHPAGRRFSLFSSSRPAHDIRETAMPFS